MARNPKQEKGGNMHQASQISNNHLDPNGDKPKVSNPKALRVAVPSKPPNLLAAQPLQQSLRGRIMVERGTTFLITTSNNC